MKYIFLIIVCLKSLFCMAQIDIKITKIEIYARIIDYSVSRGLPFVDKSDIKKLNSIYVKLKDETRFEISNLLHHLKSLKKSDVQHKCNDYDALLIVYFSDRKKEKYYIGSGDAGVYKNNIRYDYSCSFVSTVYSFLPIYYYEYGSPFYYRKPCEEIAIGNN